MIAQDYKGFVKNFLDKDLAEFVNDLPRLLSEVRQHSAAAGIAEPWRAEEAEYLLDRADGLADSLRDMLKGLLPQDHPLRED